MRQSTTQKLSYSMAKRIRWAVPNACGLTSREVGSDGIIVRLRGIEYAIVDYAAGHFIPCPQLHPGVDPIHYASVTVRKGLVATDNEQACRTHGLSILNKACVLTHHFNHLCDDNLMLIESDEPKRKLVENMILDMYDYGNYHLFDLGKQGQTFIA